MLQRGEVEGALGHFLQVLHHARPADRIVKPMVTLAAVASSGLTEFRVAWWAERPQARSAEEYRLGRVRGPRPALAPASQLGGAGGSGLGWGPPGVGLGGGGLGGGCSAWETSPVGRRAGGTINLATKRRGVFWGASLPP